MPPRTSFKGFLQLSLVSVPVKAYTANAAGSEIRLNQLHEECKSRIQYRKTCPQHGAVGNDEIVKGYEYTKGQYVVIDPDEVAKLRTASDRTISMVGFVPADTIDPIYHSGKTYYLAPDGIAGQKPYLLLARVMEEQGLHAVAKTVLSGREQVLLLRPIGRLLAMTVLSYEATVKPASDFEGEVEEAEIAPEELALTETLVNASRIADFDLAEHEDPYTGQLRALIEAKVAGDEIVEAPSAEEPKILNLMEALKASVAEAEAAAPPRKMAKSARKKKPAAKKKNA